jgi:hypothetical protein
MEELRGGRFELKKAEGKIEFSEAEEGIVNELAAIYEKYRRIPEKEMSVDRKLALIKKEIPEIEPDSAEKVLNAFIRRADKTKELGLIISPAIESINETHIQREKKAEETERKPLKIKLNLEGLKESPDYIAARNPVACDLTFIGNCGNNFGYNMRGGVVKVEGDVGEKTAKRMRGGELYIFGKVGRFAKSAFSEKRNKGKIFQMERMEGGKDKLIQVWPKEEKEKEEIT